ncbi:MAG: hypothetical protein QXD04_06310 [Candidatus Bathyarchaeia archaeon]|nr:hypothetical protein [Candidatus Bathyarchaeota archaeon]
MIIIRTISEPWLVRLSWEELATLIFCLMMDFVEYLYPIFLTPLLGDLLDLLGIASSFILFGWLGLITMLEVIPGFDILPLFTITWLCWYVSKKRKEKISIEEQLEKWR